VVVAEERAGRLAVLGTSGDDTNALIERLDLPHRPHNLAAAEGVIFATHPRAGAMSRIDLATGSVTTVPVGEEPHDVQYSVTDGRLYVSDENGRRLLLVDPESLAVIEALDLPARPHDLALAPEGVWITMIGDNRLALLTGSELGFFSTGLAPHDLLAAPDGRIWFSNWNSDELWILEPTTGEVTRAPAGVAQPHHFAVGPGGSVWVSDNGGSSVVVFRPDASSIEVGPVPHHIAFFGDVAAVAVSGAGEAVLVSGDEVIGRVPLSRGLHGVAVVELAQPLQTDGE
jgi:streptogramin lyase